MLIHEAPLRDLKIGVRCAVNTARIIGLSLFLETVD